MTIKQKLHIIEIQLKLNNYEKMSKNEKYDYQTWVPRHILWQNPHERYRLESERYSKE